VRSIFYLERFSPIFPEKLADQVAIQG